MACISSLSRENIVTGVKETARVAALVSVATLVASVVALALLSGRADFRIPLALFGVSVPTLFVSLAILRALHAPAPLKAPRKPVSSPLPEPPSEPPLSEEVLFTRVEEALDTLTQNPPPCVAYVPNGWMQQSYRDIALGSHRRVCVDGKRLVPTEEEWACEFFQKGYVDEAVCYLDGYKQRLWQAEIAVALGSSPSFLNLSESDKLKLSKALAGHITLTADRRAVAVKPGHEPNLNIEFGTFLGKVLEGLIVAGSCVTQLAEIEARISAYQTHIASSQGGVPADLDDAEKAKLAEIKQKYSGSMYQRIDTILGENKIKRDQVIQATKAFLSEPFTEATHQIFLETCGLEAREANEITQERKAFFFRVFCERTETEARKFLQQQLGVYEKTVLVSAVLFEENLVIVPATKEIEWKVDHGSHTVSLCDTIQFRNALLCNHSIGAYFPTCYTVENTMNYQTHQLSFAWSKDSSS